MRLTERDLAALDRLVETGAFASRSDALRAGLAALLREQRERDLERAYRRGYEKHPQEPWVGATGLAGLAAFDRAEGGEPALNRGEVYDVDLPGGTRPVVVVTRDRAIPSSPT